MAMLAFVAGPAQAKPVRLAVLLDTSISMRASDPQRLSILGVQLLGDLLQPGSDTIDVIPFDVSWQAPCATPAQGVVTSLAPVVSMFSARQPGDSVMFRQRLQSLGFDTPCTYFAPGLSRLLDAIPPQAANDEARVVLVLTDGASDAAEADRAQLNKLVSLAATKGVRVWWVLLGAGSASGDMASVFGNVGLGGAVSVATADDLVGELTKILTREVGWTEPLDLSLSRGPAVLALPPNLPLAQLVLLGPAGITDAAVELTEPQAGGTSSPWTPRGGPDSLVNASVLPLGGTKGGTGYVRMRLRNPAPGSWRLQRKGAGGGVSRAFVIFHPDVDAELAYQDPQFGRAARVPVGEQVCFNVSLYSVGPSGRVALRGRAVPFTPEVVLIDEQMRRPYARFQLGNQGTAGDKVADDEVWSACTVPVAAMAGRQYRSNVLVNYYQALNASGQAALNREGPVLQVLPRLRLAFSPAQIVETRRLADGDASCTEVELAAGGSELPAQSVRVTLMAWTGTNFGAIASAKPLGEDPLPPPLENASISWDGQPLTAAGRPGLELVLSAGDIGRRFRFCVQTGARHAGGSVGLTVAAQPVDPDYLRYANRQDGFTWQGEVVAPPFPWKATLIVVGVLLLIGLALFATRLQRAFPRALQIELHADGPLVGVAPQAQIPVASALSLSDRIRGASRRLVRDDGVVEWGRRDQHYLGDLRAGGADLFEFKAAVTVHQLDTFSGEVLAQHSPGTWFSPAPGAPYRLGPEGSRVVVFTYRSDPADGGM